MPEYSVSNVIYFMAFVVPGFISMQVYSQIRPQRRRDLKDSVLEAITFGAINFVLLFFVIRWVVDPTNFQQQPFVVWLVALGIFLVLPSLTPWLLVGVQTALEKSNLFLAPAPTAWDHYFNQRRSCWIIVHFSEVRRIGGRFSTRSFASSYPDPGHLYIEELWELDEKGGFVRKQPQSCGILLKPTDYQLVEFFED
jgi:hypothetical protein